LVACPVTKPARTGKRGHPRAVIDPQVVAAAARAGFKLPALARVLSCSTTTLRKRLDSDQALHDLYVDNLAIGRRARLAQMIEQTTLADAGGADVVSVLHSQVAA